MANWNYGGYTAPSSVASKEDVKNLQRQLGVTADGLWGPKTQAAYEASGMANQSSEPKSSVPAGYSTYLKDFQSLLSGYAPTISYTPASREELEKDISSYLRPAYDMAIDQRKEATVANKANIDVDAASRGMGSSTWVTDVKDRAQDSEARDIATLESQYAAAKAQQLMSALQQEKANQLAVDQYNASSQAQALQTALGLAGDFYANDLAMAQKASRGGRKKSDEKYSYQDALGAVSAVYTETLGSSEDAKTVAKAIRDAGHISDVEYSRLMKDIDEIEYRSSGRYK